MAAADPNARGLPPEVEKLANQLAKDPRSRAFMPLAEEYVKAGLLQEAATVLEDGLKVYPNFVTALVALGRVYVQMETIGKARTIFEEAIKISPDNLLAHRMLARIYVKERAWEAAGRSCDAVLFGFPKDDEMLALKREIDARPGADAAPSPPADTVRPAAGPSSSSRRTRPDVAPKVTQLQTLLARIQARRAS